MEKKALLLITEILRIIRNYCEQLHANKLETPDEIDKFLNTSNLPKLNHEDIAKLNHEDIAKLNKQIMGNEIE
jgi:hypothetical protein